MTGKLRRLQLLHARAMNRITALAFCSLLTSSACSSAPSDASLIERFAANKATYEHLRDLLSGDATLAEVGPSGIRSIDSPIWTSPPTSSVSSQQYRLYMDLLRLAGDNRASRSNGPHPEICFGVWATGWASDTKHKNICWRSESSAAGGRFTSKHIESGWYLDKD